MSNEIEVREETEQLNLVEAITDKKTAIALPDVKPGLAVSRVFSRGALGEVKSFGGVTLAENAVKVDLALANMDELNRVWNRSHSQWAWKHINLGQFSDMRNIRQIGAEITNKKAAINDAKWGQIKTEIRLRKIQERLEHPGLDKWYRLELEIELAQIKENMAEGMTFIEGCMKDILALNDMYEELKKRTSNFSEEDYEKEETRNHLRRSLTQCLRDVRQYGRISKGEQEYLEQIGANVSKVQKLMIEFCDFEEKSECWDFRIQHEFIEDLSAKLEPVAQVRMDINGLSGLNDESIKSVSYTRKIAEAPQIKFEFKEDVT